MTKFFIDHPVAATVVSVVIVVLGLVALPTLPIAQYPDITPPTIEISATYPGANARDVATQVAVPIEQEVNGVEKMLYMDSKCTNDGQLTTTVTFEVGTDLDMAQVLVQNRVNLAEPKLPDAVKRLGVSTKKKSPSIILCINLVSTDGRYDQLYLSNFGGLRVKDELLSLPGVGDVKFLGEREYSMRVWLYPDRVAQRDLTASDVVSAIQQQNAQVPAGQVGQPPVPSGLGFQYPLTTRGRLTSPRQFEDIIIKSGAEGQITRLRDVGRVDLGAKNSDVGSTLDGRPTVTIALYQLPGSNALETAHGIEQKMAELKQRFPPGLDYQIVYDTTPFITESVHEVFSTLIDAVVLVAIVVLFFLQDWKAMILPMIDVPVSLIGTLAVMKLMGFTLNNLTLFGLVLAIGIVVDDAIMVLENIERWMAMGYDAYNATIKAMREITGPIIAVTLVLCAVFIPSAFLGGITGQFFRQFALTIAASMAISAINAMTMTPSRAVQIFKGGHHDKEALPWWSFVILGGLLTLWASNKALGERLGLPKDLLAGGPYAWGIRALFCLPGAAVGWVVGRPLIRPVNRVLAAVFGGFNRLFDWVTAGYGRGVGWLLRLSMIVLAVYVGLLGLTGLGFVRVPGGFIPQQDKGYLVVGVQLPDAASLERTENVVRLVDRLVLGDEEKGGRYRGPKPPEGSKLYPPLPGAAHTVAFQGLSLLTNSNGSNLGSMFVVLDPFEERGHGPHADEVLAELRKRLAAVEEARVVAFGAPPVDGLGNASGFKLQVRDVGAAGLLTLQLATDDLVRAGNATPGLVGVNTSFRANTPQLAIKVNEDKALAMHVPVGAINDTLQIYLGSKYVNDVTLFDRNYQVNVQADPSARLRAEDVRRLQVRNQDGAMVPLGTLIEVADSSGPATVFRYNTKPAAAVTGGTVPGFSTGQAIDAMQDAAARELPQSLDYQWTELTLLQIRAGNTAAFTFGLAVLLVFLILAFQYESWTMPLAVILVVPMCVLAAIAGVVVVGSDMNIFTQIGFVVLVGLACKNAILIVEFAKVHYAEGVSAFDAAVEACRVRLRPIIMTSFAFILGVVPLLLGHGAGAEMRFALGIAVFSGMLGVTVFGIFLTPVFFYVIQWLAGGRRGEAKKAAAAEPDGSPPVHPAPATAIQAAPSPPHP